MDFPLPTILLIPTSTVVLSALMAYQKCENLQILQQLLYLTLIISFQIPLTLESLYLIHHFSNSDLFMVSKLNIPNPPSSLQLQATFKFKFKMDSLFSFLT